MIKKKMRVWWNPQAGACKRFFVPVDNEIEAVRIIHILSAYDCFQWNNHIKPDYCNTGGVEIWDEEEQEWLGWEIYEEDTLFDDVEEYCKEILGFVFDSFKENLYKQVNFERGD